jgi:hypothetical protein
MIGLSIALHWLMFVYRFLPVGFVAIGVYQLLRGHRSSRAFVSAALLSPYEITIERCLFGWERAPSWMEWIGIGMVFAGPVFFFLAGIWVYRSWNTPRRLYNASTAKLPLEP